MLTTVSRANSANQWLRSFLGPHFGLIEELQRVPCEPDDVPLAVYAGRLANTAALGALDAPRLASGAALADDDALGACIGEAVERYAAAWIPPGRVVCARSDELQGDAITPDRFALFGAAQFWQSTRRFPFVRWRPADRLGWVRALSLVDGRAVWMPAVFVYQPYVPGAEEPLIAPCLSTGLASATSWLGAVQGGLCEVIERDAVALGWLGWFKPPAIEWGETSGGRANHETAGEVATLAETLTRRGFRWRLFDLTTDLDAPVAAAIVEGHSPVGPIVAFGSACHPSPARACLKALVEAAHCRMYVKSILRERPTWRAGRRFRNVTNFAEHARFYSSHPEQRRPLDWWWAGTRSTRWQMTKPDSAAPLEWIRLQSIRMAAAGCEPFVVDVTSPDVAELGMHVARVVAPGLQPLHGHHAWRHMGGQRLRQLGRVFGSAAKQPWWFNAYPHPCP
jgi:ribosomal protein S12 methylthiotransferase accessory factor